MAKRGGFPGGMPGNMNNLMKQAQRMQRVRKVREVISGTTKRGSRHPCQLRRIKIQQR